jgi:hypothetical protein
MATENQQSQDQIWLLKFKRAKIQIWLCKFKSAKIKHGYENSKEPRSKYGYESSMYRKGYSLWYIQNAKIVNNIQT